MKRTILLLFTLLFSTFSFSQNLLNPIWKFQTGDDPSWSETQFDDSNWSEIEVGKRWEELGYENYDGYAWYRQSIMIPKKLEKAARKNGKLILRLGKIDDVDITFWNGKQIGTTGSFPPNFATEWATQRTYSIPVEAIHFGKNNWIAVRVFDPGGGGGIYAGDISLELPGVRDFVEVTLEGLPDDHILLQKENHGCQISLNNTSADENYEGTLTISATSDFGKKIKIPNKKINIKAQTSRLESIELGNLSAGFYQIEINFETPEGSKNYSFSLGVRPEHIDSPTNLPDDFEDYWMRAKRELAAVAPQFKMIRQDELCTPTQDIFLIEMRSLGNVLIRGWYGRPVAKGKYPAVLHVQGYSSRKTHHSLYQGDDMVSLVLNIRGHGNSQDHVNPGFPGYLQHFIEDHEMYIYRGAYMDCIRAVDFLFSREEVDPSRVAVEGGSQGGALSFATAALDNERIALCLPDVPFLSDWEDYFQTAYWPTNEFMKYLEEHPDFSKEEMLHTLSYIDIKNLAPRIKVPVFMAIGLVDKVCPPHINFAAYNQVTSPKEYKVYPFAGHGLPGRHYGEKAKIIKDFFGVE